MKGAKKPTPLIISHRCPGSLTASKLEGNETGNDETICGAPGMLSFQK